MGNINMADVVSIIISGIALLVSIIIWYGDKKSVWYWNIVIVPIQKIFDEVKQININDKKALILMLNRYSRSIKDCLSFLEIGVDKKKVNDIKILVENEFNRISTTIMINEDGGNYLELISSFEVQLYKMIAKHVIKR